MLAGEALDEKGDTPRAIDQFRAATHANPKEANAHFGLGYLLWTEQHFAEAAPEFAAELQLDPAHKQALEYLADSLVETNQFEKALPYVDAMAGQNGGAENSAMAHRDRGIVYAELGHSDEAIVELQKAIELDPEYVSAHWRLAKVYQSMGNKALAKIEFNLVSAMKEENSRPLSEAMETCIPVDTAPLDLQCVLPISAFIITASFCNSSSFLIAVTESVSGLLLSISVCNSRLSAWSRRASASNLA